MKTTHTYNIITFLLPAMMLIMGACTNDDVVSDSNDTMTNRITYGVSTEMISRSAAAEVYDHINVPDNVYVWAYNSDFRHLTPYFAADCVSRDGTGIGAWTGHGTQFWPDYSLSFFALAGIDATTAATAWTGDDGFQVYPYINFTVPTDAASQRDLIYAVKTNQSRPSYTNGTADANVDLDFRHSLVQVVFQARVDNPQLIVQIKEISLHNIAANGQFFMPLSDTDRTVAADQSSASAVISDPVPDYESYGSWVTNNYTPTTYTATFSPNDAASSWGAYITDGQTVTADQTMMLIPTDIYQNGAKKWRNTDRQPAADEVYFSLKCRIYRVPGRNITTGDLGDDIPIWREDTDLMLPAELVWADKQGHKMTYTFTFGCDNNGSYYGDPTKPLDVEVAYTANLSDWNEGNYTTLSAK